MDYQLLPHEYMVMDSDHVSFGKSGLSTDELILTNLHLVHIKKVFGEGKKTRLPFLLTRLKFLKGNLKFQ